MVITTWNLRQGGLSNMNKIVQVLSENRDSDILVLTEFRNNTKKEFLINSLIKIGYDFFYFSTTKTKTNSVLIASKENYEIEYFEELNNHKERVLKIKTPNFLLYGCYFPQQELKKIIFEFLLDQIHQNPNEKIIITGDLNTGRHYIDEKGASFKCAEYFDKLEDIGMIDAFRFLNGSIKEYSWYSNAGNGFRIDHFFVSTNLKNSLTKCYYKHNCRENNISDHSLMSLDVKP